MFPISDTAHVSKRIPIITYILIAITCYVFFLELTAPDLESFIAQYALIPAQVIPSDPSTWIQFFTSMFLHGGWLHIISNMWFLFVFGDNVENALGPIPYLILYFLSGIAGGIAQYVLMPTSGIPMLGASGAIAGALGAYFALFPNNKIKTLIIVFGFITVTNVSAYFMLGYWFVLQILSGAVSIPNTGSDIGGVAFWAHVGGFVAGFILSKFFSNAEDVVEGEVVE